MSCNCTPTPPLAPVNPELPGLGTLTECCTPPEPCLGSSPTSVTGSTGACSNGDALRSSASSGTTLAESWTDSIRDNNNQGITLLGRIGQKLARLVGNGFIQIRDGLAFVVEKIDLKVNDQWHEWYKPTGINRRPVIGLPLPFPYMVIADTYGAMHAIQGISGESVTTDSIQAWSYEREQWETRSIADFPLLQRGLAPRVTAIELAGFTAIPANGSSDAVRQLSVLSGSGIIVVNQQPTIASSCDCEGCEPEAAVASVATFLPAPDAEGTYNLQVAVDGDGTPTYSWEEVS